MKKATGAREKGGFGKRAKEKNIRKGKGQSKRKQQKGKKGLRAEEDGGGILGTKEKQARKNSKNREKKKNPFFFLREIDG